MRFVKARRLLPIGLLLGCIGLSWLIYQDLVTLPPEVQSQTLKISPSQTLPALVAQSKFSMPSINTFRETIQRPVFSQSRRPPEAQPVAKKATPEQPLELTVMGIIFSPKERIAFVSPQGKKSRSRPEPLLQLNEGEKYEGWTVVGITRKGVTLRQDDTEVSFELDFRKFFER